jgi:hypothetical protein
MRTRKGMRTFAAVFLASCFVVGAVLGCATMGGERVDPALHPNLAAAQGFIMDALQKLDVAQKANDFDMKGHVAKAKDLLGQAYQEIKLGALAANREK